jgi:hypothetical protein
LAYEAVSIHWPHQDERYIPKLLWLPSLLPLCSALASKLLKLFKPVTTVPLVIASNVAAAYSPPCVVSLPSKANAPTQARTPVCTTLSGCILLTTPPCIMLATKPMYPNRRPDWLEVYRKRSYVMNGRENSMPEKNRIKVKCTRLSMAWEFVLLAGIAFFDSLLFRSLAEPFTAWPLACPFSFAFPFPFRVVLPVELGNVSGRLAHR